MRSIYNVLKNLKNIEDWHVVKGEETLYPRTDYSNIEIDSLSYNNIVNYLKDLSDSSGMSIHYPKLEQIQIVNNTIDKLKQAESHFFNRAFCSGLFSSHCTSYQMDKLLCVNSYIGISVLLLEMLNPIASWKFGIQKKLSLFMRLNKRISLKILCVTAVASSKSVEHLDKYAIEI